MPNEEMDRAKDLLSKIYIDLKYFKKGENKITTDKVEQERNNTKNLSIIELINFISNYINYLLETKKENNESIVEEDNKEIHYISNMKNY